MSELVWHIVGLRYVFDERMNKVNGCALQMQRPKAVWGASRRLARLRWVEGRLG